MFVLLGSNQVFMVILQKYPIFSEISRKCMFLGKDFLN